MDDRVPVGQDLECYHWFQKTSMWLGLSRNSRVVCLHSLYTTVQAIKTFLAPPKLCAIHRSNWLAPHHVPEWQSSLVWRVLQHFKSRLNCKTLRVSIPSLAFSLSWMNVSGFWLQVGRDPWAVPCSVWHARAWWILLGRERAPKGQDSHGIEFPWDLERKAILTGSICETQSRIEDGLWWQWVWDTDWPFYLGENNFSPS